MLAGKLAAHHALCMEQQGLSTFAELMDVSQRIGVLGRMLAHATQDGTNLAFALVNFAQAVRFKHGTDPAFQSPCNMVAAMMRTSFAPMFCVPNRLGASPLSVAVKASPCACLSALCMPHMLVAVCLIWSLQVSASAAASSQCPPLLSTLLLEHVPGEACSL